MAHLGGFCCTFDYESHPSAHAVLLKSLIGNPSLEKPSLPSSRGAITIASVMLPPNPEKHAGAVNRWARSAWEAYASLHQFARGWMEHALRR